MALTYHQKFLLKRVAQRHQKYCFPDYLKISYPRFHDQYFYSSGQNLRSALADRVFARRCLSFLAYVVPPSRTMGKNTIKQQRPSLVYHEMETIFFQIKTLNRLKLDGYLSILNQAKPCQILSVISHSDTISSLRLERNYKWNLTKRWITSQKDNYKLSNSIKNSIISIHENSIHILVKRQRFIRNSLKGILLVNFPEKEKNFLIKNLAAENKIPLITQSASLLLKDSRNMDDLLGVDDPIQILFDKVKTCIPCICFINNLDRIGKQRYEHTPLGEQKSLHWLNYSISLLMNNNTENKMIQFKPINKPVFSTSVSMFALLTDQKPLQMDLQFAKQTKKVPVFKNIFKHRPVQSFKAFKTLEANNNFKPHNLKLTRNKQKFTTSYYHRFPIWLCNFRFISHLKINISGRAAGKIKWSGFNNNLKTPPRVFYLQSSGSVAWKFWIFNKKLTSPMKINFFQTLSSKIQLVSKKPESKTILASASALKTQRPFIISKLKQQTAEKKSLRFLSISDRLSINSLSSRLLFINCFSQTKEIKEQKGIYMYNSYINSNKAVACKFEMLRNKIEQIPKINTNFIALSKKKNLRIANDSFKKRRNPLLRDYNLSNNHGENKIIVPKISEIPNKISTKTIISKQSQLDKNLKVFFLATVFDNPQARSRILFERVLTKDAFNPSRPNIIFKTNRSLMQAKSVATSTLSTNKGIEHNKNNSCELDR